MRPTTPLACDSYDPIEESNQILPDQVINDQGDGKHQRHVPVVNLHDIEIEPTVARDLENRQGAAEKESQWRENEWKNRAMNPEWQSRPRGHVEYVPQPEQI